MRYSRGFDDVSEFSAALFVGVTDALPRVLWALDILIPVERSSGIMSAPTDSRAQLAAVGLRYTLNRITDAIAEGTSWPSTPEVFGSTLPDQHGRHDKTSSITRVIKERGRLGVRTPTLSSEATEAWLSLPDASRRRAWSTRKALSFRGCATCVPRRFATLMPARVRSTMRGHSNWPCQSDVKNVWYSAGGRIPSPACVSGASAAAARAASARRASAVLIAACDTQSAASRRAHTASMSARA